MIVDGDGKRLRGLVGPYNEGEPLKLTCQAEHGTFKRLSSSVAYRPYYTAPHTCLTATQSRRQCGCYFSGKPRPAVTWWKDYRLIDDSYVFDQDGAVVKNQLEVKALTRNDLLAVLVCQASNNNITVPTPSQITLDLNCE